MGKPNMSRPSITSFKGQYAFLSNFYQRPLAYNGHVYRSAEHAYQANKAWLIVEHDYVRNAPTPAEAKKRGKEIARVDCWEDIKDDVMLCILRCKFDNKFNGLNNPLHFFLLKTEDALLVEGNDWGDTYWGQCPLGNGQNKLGLLLMQVREEMRAR